MKLQMNALDNDDTSKQDKAITYAYGDKFVIPLDFEMLEGMIPY